ncbi:MAG: S9 family peptidase [Saprospiraceae bacterium]|nr:S9 family peptidase [Saprospiraceae bacterium]
MRSLVFIPFLALFIACNSDSSRSKTDFSPIPYKVPVTFADSSVLDTFYGKVVADPFRWLEDDRSDATAAWVSAQNRASFGYLEQNPFREPIRKRLEEIWNYERTTPPEQIGKYYYYFKNDGLQNQSLLFRKAGLDGSEEIILDPNKFSEDGTTALGSYAFSKSGKYLAYQTSTGGSDWRTIHVKDLETGADLEDTVNWVKFSEIAWAADGFFYSRYPNPQEGEELSAISEFQQVYYHRIGDKQESDQIVFADRSNPNRGFAAETTEDEHYLVLSVWESTSGNALYFRDLTQANSNFTPIVEDIKDDYILVGHQDGFLYFRTNNNADNWRLIRISAQNPSPGYWEDVLPAMEFEVLRDVHFFNGNFVASYLKDAISQVRVHDLEGKLKGQVQLPGIGTVSDFTGNADSAEAFFAFSSFAQPGTIYRLDLNNLVADVYHAPRINFNAEQYTTKQVWFESRDGTKVPMFLTYKKDLVMDGRRPTLLYGYGGFDISILPSFQVKRTALLENGGIYAVANIRGGGEFGKAWHLAGVQDKKQNVFDDFQAAAEYLIDQGYTSSEKLAIEGRSNGGLLIGACITQRPDLYKVAFPQVGVLDMLRYHKFTIGAAWASDYGLSDNEKGFDYLIAYSPLHNVIPADYPATMITTADHDDRVFPAHSFKFAAELQRMQQGKQLILIRIETNAGHGAGMSTEKQIQEAADMLSFMFYQMKEPIIYE